MTGLLGQSAPMERLRKRIGILAPTPLPVLIVGETGTGKEVTARALHEQSGRSGPFIPVDCGALSSSLIETELFGHERGAFTGANQRREGLVWAARGGTFFLDEIGELPMPTQTRLLRLLENGSYRPVGSTSQRESDIRVVAATWRDLKARISEGAFREDLYHRLTIAELHIAPLRDRVSDILPLFHHFASQASASALTLDTSARRHLEQWPWPGNVRELRNAAQYVAAMAPGPRIRLEDLPPRILGDRPDLHPTRPTPTAIRTDLPYMEARRELLDTFQLRYVEAQLDACEGNISAAARAAGMDRRSIQRILARSRNPEDEQGP